MDNNAMFKLTYGLFVLSSVDAGKDNGCIINTASQVTTTPNRISITVNKQNLTHDMIVNSGVFTVSVIDQTAPFELFEQFGYKTGRTADKFEGITAVRDENGVLRPTEHISAYICGKVVQSMDLGTHTLFIADVTAAEMVTGGEPVTYVYYQANIKPKPSASNQTKGWRCLICGYVYEGEELPEDFICPWCKHGAADFEKIN